MGNHSGKPLIPQQVVTAYDPIFGHLPEAERERRVLQLWTATELCALVYETSFISHLHALAQRPYIPTPISVQESGSHTTKANFFLIEFNEFVCLVFRGTFSIQDWEQNLQVRTGTWRSFRGIHQGWSDAVDCSPVGLIDDLLKKMDKELLVTGHSKGGAEAFLFSTTSKCNPVCMTFAQPHVSTEPLNLNQAQQDRFFRFYGDEDFIPRCNEMFGFQMSPAVNIMVSSGSFARTPTIESPKIDFAVSSLQHAIDVQKLFSSHYMPSFQILLNKTQEIIPPKSTKPVDVTPGGILVGNVYVDHVTCNITQAAESLNQRHKLVVTARVKNVERLMVKYFSDGTTNPPAEEIIYPSWVIKNVLVPSPENPDPGDFIEAWFDPVPDNLSENIFIIFDNGFSYQQTLSTVCFYNAWFFGDSGAGKTQLVTALTTLDGPNGDQRLYNLKPSFGEVTPAAPEKAAEGRARLINYREVLGVNQSTNVEHYLNHIKNKMQFEPLQILVMVFNCKTKIQGMHDRSVMWQFLKFIRNHNKDVEDDKRIAIFFVLTNWDDQMCEVEPKPLLETQYRSAGGYKTPHTWRQHRPKGIRYLDEFCQALEIPVNSKMPHERVFCVNSAVNEGGIVFPVHSVEELRDAIHMRLKMIPPIQLAAWRNRMWELMKAFLGSPEVGGILAVATAALSVGATAGLVVGGAIAAQHV